MTTCGSIINRMFLSTVRRTKSNGSLATKEKTLKVRNRVGKKKGNEETKVYMDEAFLVNSPEINDHRPYDF